MKRQHQPAHLFSKVEYDFRKRERHTFGERRSMRRTTSIAVALGFACIIACGQVAHDIMKADPVAMEILTPIDKAISALATNSPYLSSWNVSKTNLHWTTEGKQVLVTHLQYAHNIQKTGPLATNLQYGAEACIISIGAPKQLTYSGLGRGTVVAGQINNRDILVSCDTWNPVDKEFESLVRQTVERAVASLKSTMEKTPNK
jgi:hypothetical protein